MYVRVWIQLESFKWSTGCIQKECFISAPKVCFVSIHMVALPEQILIRIARLGLREYLVQNLGLLCSNSHIL